MTTIYDPARPAIQALFVRAHLRLMLAGMKNSHFTQREMLDKASGLTGRGYGRGKLALQLAIDHLNAMIEVNKRLEELVHATE